MPRYYTSSYQHHRVNEGVSSAPSSSSGGPHAPVAAPAILPDAQPSTAISTPPTPPVGIMHAVLLPSPIGIPPIAYNLVQHPATLRISHLSLQGRITAADLLFPSEGPKRIRILIGNFVILVHRAKSMTLIDLFAVIYEYLSVPISSQEWQSLSMTARAHIEAAHLRRISAFHPDQHVRRVDRLLGRTAFAGMVPLPLNPAPGAVPTWRMDTYLDA